MKKKKHSKSTSVNPGNPADHGVDHNVLQGIEKDVKESPIQKQESRPGRGSDNEDSSEAK